MSVPRVVAITVFLAILSVGMAGCGGSSGGSSADDITPGSDDNSGGNNEPGGGDDNGTPGMSGLDGDANNQDLLYFSHSYEQGTGTVSTLYAIDPANPEVANPMQLDIGEGVEGADDAGRSAYAPLYEADIDAQGNVENYRVSDVLFLHNRESGNDTSEGFARVSTEATTPAPVRVSSETYLGAGISGAGTLIRQNYADATHAAVVYGLNGSEKRVRMTFGDSDSPQSAMSIVIDHITPVREIDTPDLQPYLALRTHPDTECSGGHVLTQAWTSASPGPGAGTGSSISGVNPMPGGREVASAAPLGGPLSDGSQYLVLETLVNPNISGRPCLSEGLNVWRFNPNVVGRYSMVLDANGDPLVMPAGVAGPMLPSERHIAHADGVLYFGVTGLSQTGPQALYRLEGTSWSLLSEEEDNLGYATGFLLTSDGRVAASAGNTVVSWAADGSDRQQLDTSNAAWLGVQTEVLGSRDGWLFYNRADISGQDTAVAMKVDGSDSLEITDAQWIGASLTGKGDSISYMTELSEVFLWSDKEIAAVSAADPKAGTVLLGTLDATPEGVTMHGLAPGPHRLIQVHTDADNSAVYSVNTREQGSLRKALDEVGVQRPVTGF